MKKLTLFYCDAHDVWTSWECPECHLAANAKDLRMEGMQVLADFVEVHQLPGGDLHISIPRDDWYALLDKLGVVFKPKSITCPACKSTSITSCPGGTCLKPSQEAMDTIKYICMDCLAEFGDLPQKEG